MNLPAERAFDLVSGSSCLSSFSPSKMFSIDLSKEFSDSADSFRYFNPTFRWPHRIAASSNAFQSLWDSTTNL